MTKQGDREVLRLAVGHSESGAFGAEFLRSHRARVVAGVRLREAECLPERSACFQAEGGTIRRCS